MAAAMSVDRNRQNRTLCILEFYSGIGGMHYAAKGCGVNTEVVAALEINPAANAVYSHNFPNTPVLNCNIEGLTAKAVDDFAADVFLMSPPCQPYTRVGLQGASKDKRSQSFLHIIDLLKGLKHPPQYILMENVKGFETSDTRDVFVESLNQNGYIFQEFLLSPNQFGIPNSRLRYYMLAKKMPLQFTFSTQNNILDYIPVDPKEQSQHNSHHSNVHEPSTMNIDENQKVLGNNDHQQLSRYLESNRTPEYFEQFLLLQKVLSRFALVLDIVNPASTRSCCFTKAYGHYAEGTGSVLSTADLEESSIFEKYKSLSPDVNDVGRSQVLLPLGLRYFTPREVANLMCFPLSFEFPACTTVKQQYRLLGNSLNVLVVSELLRCLFHSSQQVTDGPNI